MFLNEWLERNSKTPAGFARELAAKRGGSCARCTIHQYMAGTRTPSALDQEYMAELTTGVVTKDDWHALELKRDRERKAA